MEPGVGVRTPYPEPENQKLWVTDKIINLTIFTVIQYLSLTKL